MERCLGSAVEVVGLYACLDGVRAYIAFSVRMSSGFDSAGVLWFIHFGAQRRLLQSILIRIDLGLGV